MSTHARLLIVAGLSLLCLVPACRREASRLPPPDARRPVIRSESEMAARRQEGIDAGKIVPANPAAGAAEAGPRVSGLPVPIRPGPGAVEPDILLVDNEALTVSEVLYPLRSRIAEARQSQSAQSLEETVRMLVYGRTQQAVGALLMYRQAVAGLSEQQRDIVKNGLDREIQARISREFGDSSARFERHLAEHGLTLERYRKLLEREMVARDYARERLLPQMAVRRDELLAFYRRNLERYCSPETRELWMIEAPFEAFLPPGASWSGATAEVRAQAKLRAGRHIRAAYEALGARGFEDVAREYSRGLHAAEGGAWGEISRPLQPPYDRVSRRVFELNEGEFSEPIETERGWYIVRCGKVTAARQTPFSDVQEEIRQIVTDRKYERLSADYMSDLARRATISGLETFMEAAVRQALAQPIETSRRD